MFNLSNSFAFRREAAQAKLLEIMEWGFSDDSYKGRPFQFHSLIDNTSSRGTSGPLWYLKDKNFGRRDDFPMDTRLVRPNGDVASLEYVQVGSKRFEKFWEEFVFSANSK
ncbi:hypothetical protein Gasu2_49900 [Galdieria sulphuraria]|uniref:Uncharacterized protein n=1 Tax=Galdieria sulphuraria TaxID=130081 RepID=M2W4T0_GALSU|nr:uncharacterized protein Gasu_19850 [Galdieria sulphuraria]EME30746.1 hypothetical protein Gasu_19850 [Galdieria sulphuraria]GJD10820.1 hypothetical protein Gasu2_49900 [Galdieria sulphuraria]|eukprot:XP_005707266.1 hypothetical protein Gasu_19850 [Galdieria sulphuraria]